MEEMNVFKINEDDCDETLVFWVKVQPTDDQGFAQHSPGSICAEQSLCSHLRNEKEVRHPMTQHPHHTKID